MTKLAMTALSLSLLAPPARSAGGLIALPCAHAPAATLDRLAQRVEARGMRVVARFDHAARARESRAFLRPTEVLLFIPHEDDISLLQCSQTYGLDLPLRVLAWEDESGTNWIGYADPDSLGDRHLSPECDSLLRRLTLVLDELVRSASRA